MVLAETPKLDKGGHKLNLVALGADMSQTDHKVVREQALDDDAGVNSSEIEVDGKSVDHVELIYIDKVFKDVLELCLWDVLDPSMFYKFLQNFEEDKFWFFEGGCTLVGGEAGNYFIFDNLEEEIELIGFNQKLKRNNNHFKIVLLLQQILYHLWHFFHPS